ncbi:MAG: hypothetical protein L0Z53_18760, partial [Acidobacteriales bacterium]|nr:hypothetical protein [Terriglobales bacterium]
MNVANTFAWLCVAATLVAAIASNLVALPWNSRIKWSVETICFIGVVAQNLLALIAALSLIVAVVERII